MLGFIKRFRSKKIIENAQKKIKQYESLEIEKKLEERKILMGTISMMKQVILPNVYKRYMEYKKLSLNYIRDYYSKDKRLTKTEAKFVKADIIRKQYEILNQQINYYKINRIRLQECNRFLKFRGY